MGLLTATAASHKSPPIDEESIVIGLVNNMPDAALRTTERQFRELLAAASQNRSVSLRFFSLPELPRSEAGRAHILEYYEDISRLWESKLDGLIVTGNEPRAPLLSDEPYWGALARLIDWTQTQRVPTVWSCLGAHAAVLHLDGITRVGLGEKLSGVFTCMKTQNHPMVEGVASRWRMPHSRYNGLPEEALLAHGYRIISRSPETGADTFIKEGKSLSIFFQGHPEYDRGALLREYRRDVGRFLAGERDAYPEMPRDYFDSDSATTFMEFRDQAWKRRDPELLQNFPAAQAEAKLVHAWREAAAGIYANWLSFCRNGRLTGTITRSQLIARRRK